MTRVLHARFGGARFVCACLALLCLPLLSRASTLPIPSSISVEQDDRNAILVWDGGVTQPSPSGVAGYRITWGLAGHPLTSVKLTTEHTIQLQPLQDGQNYEAQIQSVDSLGNLSTPSDRLAFHPDPTRVNMLRQQMTGFFDDFNQSAGAFDELKWNTAYSACNDFSVNGAFINAQFHAHNMVGNLHGWSDRTQVVNRPRALFDFTGRVGTLVFDFDGVFRRDNWYLDMVPQLMDITGQVNVGGQSPAHPGNYIRFWSNNQALKIIYVNSQGVENTLAVSDGSTYPMPQLSSFRFIPNVRRHWVIHFSQTSAEIQINGTTVLKANFQLNYTRVIPMWTQIAYNPIKANFPVTMLHWDNFGFDGPRSGTASGGGNILQPAPVVTHNYRIANDGTDYVMVVAPQTASKTLVISDSIARARAVRLMFTMMERNYSGYVWSPNDSVTINGTRFSIPQPTSSTGLPSSSLVDYCHPYCTVMYIPRGVFQQGNNTLVFALNQAGILNIHAEFDFPVGSEPPYTQTSLVAQGCDMPALQDIGPGATVVGVGAQKYLYDAYLNTYTVSGTTPIDVWVTSTIALAATGSNPGVARVEILVDGQVVASQVTNAASPAPQVRWTFSLDTTQFTNGAHLLYVRAYNPTGVESYPDYDGMEGGKDMVKGAVPIVIAN